MRLREGRGNDPECGCCLAADLTFHSRTVHSVFALSIYRDKNTARYIVYYMPGSKPNKLKWYSLPSARVAPFLPDLEEGES
jgi:hypothetical protein